MRTILSSGVVPIFVFTSLLLSGYQQTLLAIAIRPVKKTTIFLDLQPKANQKLSDNFHSGANTGNNLANLPKGYQTFAGVKFHIGNSLIQLASPRVPNKPARVKGIEVGQAFATMYILHAT